jgi:hypothetical protein
MKHTIMMILALCMIAAASALEIESPVHRTYNDTAIRLEVSHNETLDMMEYSVDGSNFSMLCTNCSSSGLDMEISDGDHNISVRGTKGNASYIDTVGFSVDVPMDFAFAIVSPVAKTYYGEVPIEIRSNTTLDRIRVEVGGHIFEWTNASALVENVNLSNGTYVLKATGMGEITREAQVTFTVGKAYDGTWTNKTQNKTRTNATFDLGFQNLPKLVEDGQVDDDELAHLLRTYQMNPGIINRLIKTGKLENASLSAILDNQQHQPQGIWNRLLMLVGLEKSPSALIYERYNLSKGMQKKLIQRDDLPKGIAKKVQDDLEVEEQDIDSGDESEESLNVGKQIPPGQVKKLEVQNTKQDRDRESEADPKGSNGQARNEEKKTNRNSVTGTVTGNPGNSQGNSNSRGKNN